MGPPGKQDRDRKGVFDGTDEFLDRGTSGGSPETQSADRVQAPEEEKWDPGPPDRGELAVY